MNYKKVYDRIIAEAERQCRYKTGYYERHHILPKSLGGDDDPDNLVYLTAREHFICHWLLTKIYPDGEEHWKALNAFRMMRAENPKQTRYQTKITARVYANLKEEYAVLQSKRVSGKGNPMFGRSHSEQARQKISKANSGRVQPQYEKEKQIVAQTGKKRKPFSKEWRENLSKAGSGENNSMYGKQHTDESKQKMREKALGRKQSAETIQKKADAIRGLKREKKHCIHCGKDVAVNGYARWHGDNCKFFTVAEVGLRNSETEQVYPISNERRRELEDMDVDPTESKTKVLFAKLYTIAEQEAQIAKRNLRPELQKAYDDYFLIQRLKQ
jgi:hypothetical protein